MSLLTRNLHPLARTPAPLPEFLICTMRGARPTHLPLSRSRGHTPAPGPHGHCSYWNSTVVFNKSVSEKKSYCSQTVVFPSQAFTLYVHIAYIFMYLISFPPQRGFQERIWSVCLNEDMHFGGTKIGDGLVLQVSHFGVRQEVR